MLFRNAVFNNEVLCNIVFASHVSWLVPLILGIFIASALYLCSYELPAKRDGKESWNFRMGKISFSPELYFTIALSLICVFLLILRLFFPDLFLPRKFQVKKSIVFPEENFSFPEQEVR